MRYNLKFQYLNSNSWCPSNSRTIDLKLSRYTYKTIVFGYWASTEVSLPPLLVIMASNLSKFGEGGGTSHILPASFKVETSYCVPPSSQLRGLSILSLFLQCWGTPYFTPQPPSFKVGTRFILCPQSLPPSQLRGFSIIFSPLIQSRDFS